MNTELSSENNRTCSKAHGKIANNNSFRLGRNNIRLQCLELSNNMLQELIMAKKRHGMNLLIAYNKSLLLTMSQKGTEDMMAPM